MRAGRARSWEIPAWPPPCDADRSRVLGGTLRWAVGGVGATGEAALRKNRSLEHPAEVSARFRKVPTQKKKDLRVLAASAPGNPSGGVVLSARVGGDLHCLLS